MSEPTFTAPPVVVTPTQAGPFRYVVVGAGGTGARIVPPLMQMITPADSVTILDHDIVEDRNLARQHFTTRDIGLAKAEVLASRYRRPNITPLALHTKLTSGIYREIPRNSATTIILGCVDNLEARQEIERLAQWTSANHGPAAWIDAGNATRDGQVLLNLYQWGATLAGSGLGRGVTPGQPWAITLHTIRTAFPQLLAASAAEQEESCGVRLDLQTVQVNLMAASAALNILSWLTLKLPFTSAGMFFSCYNTMQPIRLMKVTSSLVVEPETTFAAPAAA